MPIIELPTPGTPLSQGDILKGVPLHFSKRSADTSWIPGTDKKVTLCLVLSRQCVVEHKPMLTVAAVEKYPGGMPANQEFKSALAFLENLRDGNKSPDVFYLGQLPGETGRYCARIDFLSTIEIPHVSNGRQDFIDKYRVAKLHKDFVRDLHLRVFQSFASMGYEDYRWVADAELKWLITTGEAEINKDKEDQKIAQAAMAAEGKPTETGETKKIAEIRKIMVPYQAELEQRFLAPPPEPAPEEPPAPEITAGDEQDPA